MATFNLSDEYAKNAYAKHLQILAKLLDTNMLTLIETNTKAQYDYDYKLPIGKWSLTVKGVAVASFELYPMINCCGICVSTRAWVNELHRGKGIGKQLNLLRMDIARNNGYSLLLCTDQVGNDYQRKILSANGWRDIVNFRNKRTGNELAITVVDL